MTELNFKQKLKSSQEVTPGSKSAWILRTRESKVRRWAFFETDDLIELADRVAVLHAREDARVEGTTIKKFHAKNIKVFTIEIQMFEAYEPFWRRTRLEFGDC